MNILDATCAFRLDLAQQSWSSWQTGASPGLNVGLSNESVPWQTRTPSTYHALGLQAHHILKLVTSSSCRNCH